MKEREIFITMSYLKKKKYILKKGTRAKKHDKV